MAFTILFTFILIGVLIKYFIKDFETYYHNTGTSIHRYSSVDAGFKAMERNRYHRDF